MKNKQQNLLYPCAGMPFLPKIFINLVGNRSIIDCSGQSRFISDFTDLYPSDFDQMDCQLISQQISGIVQSILYSKKNAQDLACLRINVPKNVCLHDLRLNDRARIALQSRSIFNASGYWRDCNLLELSASQALGAKLMMALLLSIEEHMTSFDENFRRDSTCIEQDLNAILFERLHCERSVKTYAMAHGWDGGGMRSLLSIGKEHGCSKERARQILTQSQFVMLDHDNDPKIPDRLMRAISLLLHHSPITVEKAQKLLIQESITKNNFHPSGILDAAKVMGIHAPIEIVKINGFELILKENDLKNFHSLSKIAAAMSRSLGMMSDRWLMYRARAQSIDTSMELVRLALQCEKGIAELSVSPIGGDKWYLSKMTKKSSGVIVRLLKIIAYFGRATLRCLESDLQRDTVIVDLGLPGKVPSHVICSLLTDRGFAPDKSGFWSPSTPRAQVLCENIIADVERQIANLVTRFQLHGCTRQIKDLALADGINTNTLLAYLRHSPLITKDESGLPKLVNHKLQE